MKGQQLFTRPIERADFDEIRRFLEAETGAAKVPACGLLGKLVGELVAVAGMSITADAIEIDGLVVASALRRKRIGRVMVDEIDELAAKIDRRSLVVNDAAEAGEFFKRVGFEREGARWSRKVRSQGARRAPR